MAQEERSRRPFVALATVPYCGGRTVGKGRAEIPRRISYRGVVLTVLGSGCAAVYFLGKPKLTITDAF